MRYNIFMQILFGFIVFIFGTIIGSFLNVVLLRKNTGKSLVFGGSKCFSCGKNLSARELIPILSFLRQRGKCFHCGSKISWQYPLVEFLTGLIAISVYSQVGLGFSMAFYFVAFAALFLVSAYDFKHKIIDSQLLYIFGAFAVVVFFLRGNYLSDIISSASIALFFYLLWFFSGGKWMGRGDTDVSFFISLFLGFPLNLSSIILSFWIGGIWAIILLLLSQIERRFISRRFHLKSEIPLAPFMALAAFFSWFFSSPLLFLLDKLFF